jgi:four helix bundle protein
LNMYESAFPIWQKATEFLVPLYALTNKFPKDELAGRINQLRAAAVGIALNLAEGLSCESEPDLQHFLDSSLQAARDCITELRIANRLNLCPPREVDELIAQAEEIARMLTGLINHTGQPATT